MSLPSCQLSIELETAARREIAFLSAEMGSIDDHPMLVSFLSQKYTHLVVGGGTAGLVVAARLSENPNITVGVLEAGSAAFDDPKINVPGRFGETLGSDYDWQFDSTPQPGLNGRSLPWPRGRVLGGTSALNFMTWNRGCREDYDAWEELGAEGWGWKGLLWVFYDQTHDLCVGLTIKQTLLQKERNIPPTRRRTPVQTQIDL